jgi:predicted metalloprotease with PDZ domain
MRLAFARYSGARGYTTGEFINAVSETAGIDLTSWFHKALDTTDELEYSDALDWFGLEFKKVDPPKADNRPKAWAGFQTRVVNGHVAISAIPRGTPAANSGLAVDDEIIAIDDWRVLPDGWGQRLEQYSPRDTVEVLLSRRDRILRVPLTLGEEPAFKWQLQINAKATPEQKRHFAAWLGPKPPSIPATASAPAR